MALAAGPPVTAAGPSHESGPGGGRRPAGPGPALQAAAAGGLRGRPTQSAGGRPPPAGRGPGAGIPAQCRCQGPGRRDRDAGHGPRK